MQAKRVVAKDMRAALQIVREELGADAIILSNKKVPQGVELVCSLDPDFLDDSKLERVRAERAVKSQMTDVTLDDHRGTTPLADGKPALEEKREPTRKVSAISPLAKELEAMQSEAKRRAQQIRVSLQRKSAVEKVAAVNRSASSISDVDFPDPLSKKADTDKLNNEDEPVSKENTSELFESSFHELNNVKKMVQTSIAPQAVSQENDGANPVAGSDDILASLRSELNSMRHLLQQQLGGVAWNTFNEKNPRQALLWRRLNQIGLGASVIRDLVSGIEEGVETEDAWFKVLSQIGRHIPIWRHNILEEGGVHAFVGPTGVGKTTTIGKLAVQHVLKQGKEGVALVTLDTHRIAANEQLRAFGRILDIPVKTVDKPENLGVILHSLRKKSLVLIDTAGLTTGDELLAKQRDALYQLKSKVKTHLVLATTAQHLVIERAYQTYKSCGLTSCVLTKLDETGSLGGTLNLLIQEDFPVSYVTDGQKVPDDICSAKGNALITQAVKLGRNVSQDEHLMAEEFAQAWPDESVLTQSFATFAN